MERLAGRKRGTFPVLEMGALQNEALRADKTGKFPVSVFGYTKIAC
jgi:hypothetical protein